MRYLLIALAATLTLAASAQSAAPALGCAPLEVAFAPPDGDGGPFAWEFGNGASSTEARPRTVFTEAGTYVVTLRRGPGGAVVGTVDVEVFASPTLSLEADPPRGCGPLTTTLAATVDLPASAGDQRYRYAFGDGSAGEGNPVEHTYESIGGYDVTVELRTDLPSCNATETFFSAVTVTAAPEVDFAISPDPPVRCEAPAVFQVQNLTTGEEPFEYLWIFGQGDSSRLAQPESITYTEPGDYVVRLIATDATGCEREVSRRVSVGSPTADFNLPDTVCLGTTYEVSALGAGASYAFDFGPGITVLAQDGPEASVRFDQPGEVTASLSVTSAGCSGDTTRTLFVQGLDLNVTSTPDESCTVDFGIAYSVDTLPGATVAWTFSYDTSGATGAEVTKDYTYDEGGPFGYNRRDSVVAGVTVTTPAGCSFDGAAFDFVDVPNALYVPSTLRGCAPLEVTFFDSSRTGGRVVESYVFDWGDGEVETVAGPGPWTHVYAQPGEYAPRLIVSTVGGCRDTSLAYAITAGELQGDAVSFTADVASTCPGDVLTFTNTTPNSSGLRVHFEVEGGDAAFCPNDAVYEQAITQPIEGDEIDLRLFVDDRGCVDSSTTASYPYVGAPLARLDYRVDCPTPFEVTLFDSTSRGLSADTVVVFANDPAVEYRRVETLDPLDSLRLTVPELGVYTAVLTARAEGAAADCPPSRDTVTFYVTEPVADFEVDTLLCGGQPILLDASASRDVNATCGLGYQWEFTFDRPFVTDTAVNQEISGPNNNLPQTIALIVDDINGCRDTATRGVRFFNTTPVVRVADDRICLPADVDFDVNVVTDTTISSYSWDFGGFAPPSDEEDPSPVSFTAGPDTDVIPITLTTEDVLGCPGEAELLLEVYEPTSRITTEPLPRICEGESITFTASDFTEEGSSLSFAYDFRNGQTSTNQTATVTYEDAGLYLVRLDYTEIASGCSGTTSLNVDVQSAPQVAFTSDVADETSVCFPQIVTFTDASTSRGPYTPIWIADGSSTTDSVFAAGLPRGTTEVTLIGVTSAGCADTASREVTLVGPDGDFTVPDRVCVGDEVEFALIDTVDVASFTFDFGNGVTVDDVDPATVTYTDLPPDGRRVVSLTLRSATSECDFSVRDTIDFFEVIADFVVDDGGLAACGTDVSFAERAVQAEVYSYDFAGLGTSSDPNPDFTFPGEGSYEVTLTTSLRDGTCRDSVTQIVEVLGPLEINVDAGAACLAGDLSVFVSGNREIAEVVIDPFGPASPGRGGSFLVGPVNGDVVIDVTARDAAGCEASVNEIFVEAVAAFEGTGDTSVIVRGGSATLDLDDAPEGLAYRWQDPAATGCVDCPSPTVSPEETTRYILEVTDANGCASSALVFTVLVLDAPIVPNLFTPNGDGSNDDWGPLLPEGAEPTVETYRVYSRWGALVFEGTDIVDRWDGETSGGEEAPSDVYAYVIELIYPGGQEFAISGEVTLMR